MQQPNYNIYPSLLDAFTWYKKSESPNAKQELIDKINRVPFESEAADKGTAFNELVDDFGILDNVVRTNKGTIRYNGFEFKEDLVKAFKKEVAGAIPQQRVEGTIETKSGTVFLYGYTDEILGDNCIDIKTTGSYEFPKFLHHWQHIVYPYCLNRMGIECNLFTYLITDFTNIFKEDYEFKGWEFLSGLKTTLDEFIFFLETNRPAITDRKIFCIDTAIEKMYHDELDKRVVA